MLKYLSFGLCALLVLLLVAATVVEKQFGSATAARYVYASPWVVALWAVMAVSSLIWLVKRVSAKSPMTLLLHFAFAVILAGALVTHLFGQQGTLMLEEGRQPVSSFLLPGGKTAPFPFSVRLLACRTEYYPGTSTGMDYVSEIEVKERGGSTIRGTISMNRVFSHSGYRFYQTGIGKGRSTLSIAYDPWGIGITYAGYLLLLIGMTGFLFQRRSRFRQLLRSPLLKTSGLVVALFLGVVGASAEESAPRTLQRGLAKSYGRLYVYYGDRVCPLQTLAKDFCNKLCGSSTYKGLTAEQVLTGWIFYYDDWKNEPMIKIKGDKVKRLLGVEGSRVALSDFYDRNGYKLAKAGEEMSDRDLQAADEKAALAGLVCTGAAIKIYPYKSSEGTTEWLSWVDKRPAEMPLDQWKFILGSMEFVAREIQHGKNVSANEALLKIKAQQRKLIGESGLPSDAKFEAEIFYNHVARSLPAAVCALCAGLLAFFVYCRSLVSGRAVGRRWERGFDAAALLLFLYLSLVISLRGFVSGHWPLSNGFETMQFMALCSLLLSSLLCRRFRMLRPFGLITCGLALMVATMGESNPPITHLMPVLASPLLSVHVMVIMLAYALLSFTFLNGITALVFRKAASRGGRARSGEQVARLAAASRLLLYPALFLLAAGIFVGAVWANQSWGRYWGWDPKEVWALITLLVYAVSLHDASLPWLRRPATFHVYQVLAFATVLMTYFGVNFLLGGMHSYA